MGRKLPQVIQASSYDDWFHACTLSDIPENQGLAIQIGDREIVVFQVDGEVHALDNLCPHLYYRLSHGPLCGNRVLCAGHCLSFNLENGMCDDTSRFQVQRHQAKTEGSEVYAKLSDPTV